MKKQAIIFSLFALNYSIDISLGTFLTYMGIAVFIHVTKKPLFPSYMVFILGYYRKICESIGMFFVRAVTHIINAHISIKRIEVVYHINICSYQTLSY